MSDARPQSSGARRIGAAVLVMLLVIVVVAGVFLLVHWVHAKKVKAERVKYRHQAETTCVMTGYTRGSGEYKQCVENYIDVLIDNSGRYY